jgi:hypothetical protein
MDTLRKADLSRERRPWEPPAVKPVGMISDMVQAGGGKISVVVADPGDAPLKPKGQG